MKNCNDGRVKGKTSLWAYISGDPEGYATIMCTTCYEVYKNVNTSKYKYCPNCGRPMKNKKK